MPTGLAAREELGPGFEGQYMDTNEEEQFELLKAARERERQEA